MALRRIINSQIDSYFDVPHGSTLSLHIQYGGFLKWCGKPNHLKFEHCSIETGDGWRIPHFNKPSCEFSDTLVIQQFAVENGHQNNELSD